MLLVIDNFDSFTYNLVQAFGDLGAELMVRRNNQIECAEIETLAPAAIVISPGPGRPEDAGPSIEVIRRFGSTIPILGVCLGHQAIGVAFGGAVVRAPHPVHGKTSIVDHDARGLFEGIAVPFRAARYHSLIVEEHGLPDQVEISARTEHEGLIMGLRHREWPVFGVQFHPESVLTREGPRMLANFLRIAGVPFRRPFDGNRSVDSHVSTAS
jgi:anthranilate synthase/aminodeoxychorismate synthase-like glutamine amidotransferase